MIEYKHGKGGGFFAHDTETGATCYAFPSSPSAVAARRNPERVAAEMIAKQRELSIMPIYQEHNAYIRSRMIAE